MQVGAEGPPPRAGVDECKVKADGAAARTAAPPRPIRLKLRSAYRPSRTGSAMTTKENAAVPVATRPIPAALACGITLS
jgi:hypothetical protein